MSCKVNILSEPARQTAQTIKEAEKLLRRGSYPECEQHLVCARNLLAASRGDKQAKARLATEELKYCKGSTPPTDAKADIVKARDTLVLASFFAGQARNCPLVTNIKANLAKLGNKRRRRRVSP